MARRAKAKHYRKQAARKQRAQASTTRVPLHEDIRQRALKVEHVDRIRR